MPVIAVNHGQMEAAAGQVQSTWGKLESQFAELQGLVGRLAQAWQGEDQQAYGASQKKWNDAAAELNQGLKGIGNGVTTANQNFLSATQANVRTWQ